MAESSRADVKFILLRPDNRPPRDETTGGADLLDHFGLKGKYEQVQAANPPPMISGTGYLAKIVGDSELRKGPGMDLASLAVGLPAPLPSSPSSALVCPCRRPHPRCASEPTPP